MRPLLRAQLRSQPANGHVAFVPQIRKLVFEYCDKWPSSTNTRTYILNHVESLAQKNPHIEVVVKQRNHKEPILRGFYGNPVISLKKNIYPTFLQKKVNNRDKVIPLNSLQVNAIQNKVQLLLDSSGAKIQSLKRRIIESSTESTRGIWSGLHADPPLL